MKATVAAFVAFVSLVGCGLDHTVLRAKSSDWQTKADAEIPAGRTVEDVKTWGAKNGVSFHHVDQKRWLYAIVGRVPESGFGKYVCSDWEIILKVSLTASGTTANNKISTVGRCV
jgi:hypothetical protein